MVHFVGAGPGAVDLITVRGARLIREADVIIYAGSLVNLELLAEAKEGCRVYDSARMTLEDIIAVMEEAENKRETVVRLHTGEPSLYGAVREQMDALDELGISYDSTPGVTAAFGAAASLNLEYTIPEVSQTLILTRMEGRTPVPERESIAKLATHQTSMVIYLSAGQAEQLREELLAGGYGEETPVAVVYKATWVEEKIIYSTLNKFPAKMAENGIANHAVILVGDAIGYSAKTHSFPRSKLYDSNFSTGYRQAKKLVDDNGKKINLNIISFTSIGDNLGTRIEKKCVDTNMDIKLYPIAAWQNGLRTSDIVKSSFDNQIPILLIGAMGICVRLVAPYMKDKMQDIPVLVMDEKGEYIIPVLSGHIGGANRLAEFLAKRLNATAVLTTATDVQGVFAVDVWATEQGLSIVNKDGIQKVSSKLLAGQTVTLTVQDDRFEIGEGGLPEGIEIVPWAEYCGEDGEYAKSGECLEIGENFENSNNLTSNTNRKKSATEIHGGADICIMQMDKCCNAQKEEYDRSVKDQSACDGCPNHPLLYIAPKRFVIGVGCKKGISEEQLEKFVKQVVANAGINWNEIAAIATIDRKANEEGLIAFCRKSRLPLMTYLTEKLSEIRGDFAESSFVQEMVGVDNVCERSAAVYASDRSDEWRKVVAKTAKDGMTAATYEFGWKVVFP